MTAVEQGVDGRLKLALRIGAGIWLALLVVGFFAPGSWKWGMAGPIGHMQNYMISLWFVALVAAPFIATGRRWSGRRRFRFTYSVWQRLR